MTDLVYDPKTLGRPLTDNEKWQNECHDLNKQIADMKKLYHQEQLLVADLRNSIRDMESDIISLTAERDDALKALDLLIETINSQFHHNRAHWLAKAKESK